MNLPEYITKEEVRRVCRECGLSDWTAKDKADVSDKEAKTILTLVNVKGMDIPLEDFRKGLEVEMEHGIQFDDANVTNNHPILTGKIVLAHLKETMDYYKLLDVAEYEGDLLKAVVSGNVEKIRDKYKKLAQAQKILAQAVEDQLS